MRAVLIAKCAERERDERSGEKRPETDSAQNRNKFCCVGLGGKRTTMENEYSM